MQAMTSGSGGKAEADPDSAAPQDGGLRAKYGRRMAKKKLQKIVKGKGSTQDYFDVYGPQARAEITLKTPAPQTRPLVLEDVQNLILWLFSEGISPQWAFVKNKPLISRVVVLLMPGLGRGLYSRLRTAMPNMARVFGDPMEVAAVSPVASLSATLEALFMRAIPRVKEKGRRKDAEPGSAGQEQGASSGTATNTPALKSGHTGAPTASTRPSAAASAAASSSHEGAVRNLHAAAPSGGPNGTLAESARQPPAPHQAAGGAPSADPGSPPGPHPPGFYALSPEEMQQNGYPLPTFSLCPQTGAALLRLPPGYVATVQSVARTSSAGGHSMVAIDCEMCVTGSGLELTRLTLLGHTGEVLLDELVLPDNPIVDYNTRYSGITASLMKGVTTSLQDVRERFLALVSADTLLVGHSVEADLNALRVVHHRVIDTALLYPHPRGPPLKCALRTLAAMHLGRRIQDAGERGHDSVEDARAALDLVHLKIREGPDFGSVRRHRGRQESILEVLQRSGGTRCVVVDHNLATIRSTPFRAASCIFGKGGAWDVLHHLGKEMQKKGQGSQIQGQGQGQNPGQGLLAVGSLTQFLSALTERASSLDKIGPIAAEAAASVTNRGTPAGPASVGGGPQAQGGEGRAPEGEGKEEGKGEREGESGVKGAEKEAERKSKGKSKRESKKEKKRKREGPGAGQGEPEGPLGGQQQRQQGQGRGKEQGEGQGGGGVERRDGDSTAACNSIRSGRVDTHRQGAAEGVPEARAQGTPSDRTEKVGHQGRTNGVSEGGPPPAAAAMGDAARASTAGLARGDAQGGAAESLEAIAGRVDAEIGKFVNGLAPNVAVLVVTGFGDSPAVRRMREWRYKRLQWEQTGMVPWDGESGDAVLRHMEQEAARGLLFAAVKQ